MSGSLFSFSYDSCFVQNLSLRRTVPNWLRMTCNGGIALGHLEIPNKLLLILF